MGMRGSDAASGSLFSYVDMEARVPVTHPLRAIRTIVNEVQLMEQINYNLLFRWFVGLGIDDAVWDHSTFSKNRERLLGADVAAKSSQPFCVIRSHALLSDERFFGRRHVGG